MIPWHAQRTACQKRCVLMSTRVQPLFLPDWDANVVPQDHGQSPKMPMSSYQGCMAVLLTALTLIKSYTRIVKRQVTVQQHDPVSSRRIPRNPHSSTLSFFESALTRNVGMMYVNRADTRLKVSWYAISLFGPRFGLASLHRGPKPSRRQLAPASPPFKDARDVSGGPRERLREGLLLVYKKGR